MDFFLRINDNISCFSAEISTENVHKIVKKTPHKTSIWRLLNEEIGLFMALKNEISLLFLLKMTSKFEIIRCNLEDTDATFTPSGRNLHRIRTR
jgi:hypothetical protein